jgi:hypothetical protein
MRDLRFSRCEDILLGFWAAASHNVAVGWYQRFIFSSTILNLNPEDGGSTALRNVGIQTPNYTAQKPRNPRRKNVLINFIRHRLVPNFSQFQKYMITTQVSYYRSITFPLLPDTPYTTLLRCSVMRKGFTSHEDTSLIAKKWFATWGPRMIWHSSRNKDLRARESKKLSA